MFIRLLRQLWLILHARLLDPRVMTAIARRRESRIVGFLTTLCYWFVDAANNTCASVLHNGEATLLTRLASVRPAVIFDVGANIGEWTAEARHRCPSAVIHAFEVVPAIAEKFEERHRGDARVILNDFGLGDEKGTARFFFRASSPGGTSIYGDVFGGRYEAMDREVARGDDYVLERGMDRIDLLKIDVEGAEHRVLLGFTDMFARGAIDVIQFEYGYIHSRSRFSISDFFDFFASRGYILGRIFPERVELTNYRVELEDFRSTPNWVAIRHDRPDLIRILTT